MYCMCPCYYYWHTGLISTVQNKHYHHLSLNMYLHYQQWSYSITYILQFLFKWFKTRMIQSSTSNSILMISVWIRFHEIKPYLLQETLATTIFQRKSKRFETKSWTGLKTSKLLCIQYVWQKFSCLNLLQYMIYHSWNLWTDLSVHMPAQIISYIIIFYWVILFSCSKLYSDQLWLQFEVVPSTIRKLSRVLCGREHTYGMEAPKSYLLHLRNYIKRFPIFFML